MIVELGHHAKFCGDRQNRCRYRGFGIFWIFFQMTAAAILDLRIFKFLMVGTVKTIELCHCAKCRRNRSNLGRDIAIFQDGGSRHIGFLKFLIFNGRASFRGDQSNRFRDIAIFEFFKIVAAAILDFTNFNF